MLLRHVFAFLGLWAFTAHAFARLEYKVAVSQIKHMSASEFGQLVLSPSSDKWYIFFGAEWCHHCQKATPFWRDFARDYSAQLAKHGIELRKVECTEPENEKICTEYAKDGFPAMWFFAKGLKLLNQDLEKFPPNVAGFQKFTNQNLVSIKEDPIEVWLAADPASSVHTLQAVADFNEEMHRLSVMAKETYGEKKTTNPEGVSVDLTDVSFAKVINDGNWFVMFHAPWCGHCKELSPKFVAAASKLVHKVNIAKVDCTAQQATCEKYKVKGFPTLKFFQYGEVIQNYQGERNTDALVAFAEDFVSHPAFSPIAPESITQSFSNNENSFFFVYPIAYPTETLATFETVAKKLRAKAAFYMSPGNDAFKALLVTDTSKPALVAVKDFGHEEFYYFGPFSGNDAVDGVKTFVEKHMNPLVYNMTGGNSRELMDSGKLIVLAALDSAGDEFRRQIQVMRKAAREWHTDHKKESNVLFAILDGSKWESYISRVFQIGIPDLPRFVLMDPSLEVHYDENVKGERFMYSRSEILNMIDAVQSGSLHGRAKYTHGYFSAQMKKVGLLFEPYAAFMMHHPIISMILVTALIVSFLYYVTSEEDDRYASLPLKTTSKAD
ncbi:MAG: hypothetical protein SGCHY_005545 [Lobulomycetales sp.]